jgi:hypothetical protein
MSTRSPPPPPWRCGGQITRSIFFRRILRVLGVSRPPWPDILGILACHRACWECRQEWEDSYRDILLCLLLLLLLLQFQECHIHK